MTQTSISNHIAQTYLFQGLDADQIDRIARRTERVLFQAGDYITIQGEVGDKAILIVEGEIDCVAGVGTDMNFEGDQVGAMLGEMAMFIDDFEHPATFKARKLTKALLIDRREMLQELANDRDLTDHLVRQVRSRLNGLIAQMRDIEQDLQTPVSEIPAQPSPR